MIGLRNYGNNCFINSVIQALRYYNPVLDKLVDVYPRDPLTSSLCDLLFQGSDHTYSTFIKNLPDVGVDPYSQGDAHEFYLKVMDKLEEYVDTGTTTSLLTCECGHRLENVERLACLSVNGDVAEGIQNYLAPETVSATCERCGRAEMRKVMKLDPTDVLVIHTKRFTLGDKLHYEVSLSPIVCANRKWKVVAVCNHYGNYSGGHYTTCALTSKGWHVFNDETVHETDNLPERSTLPYILFYVPYGESLAAK